MEMRAFRETVYSHYARLRRPMPWRDTRDAYRITVSEIMLQQTQVPRVLVKYPEFIKAFSSVEALARAPLRRVLRVWQGMGYNRRALYLKKLAQAVVKEHAGVFPADRALLLRLPGIGEATASSICAFAFGQPYPFIETNIRSVFIHHFFAGRKDVSDREILPLVERALDRGDPRNWYYALMDYGVHLKASLPNPSRRSVHYKKQPRLDGSVRQARARIVRYLVEHPGALRPRLLAAAGTPLVSRKALAGLLKDGLVRESSGRYSV
jgi:A/G-specific adenine glycosylase